MENASVNRIQSELAERGLRLLSFPLGEGVPAGDDPQSNVRWHQIALEGEWEGHWQGSFSLKERDFEQMVANGSAEVETLVDYEHGSLFTVFNPQSSKAAGWGEALAMRRGEQGATLHARIRWTPAAAAAIGDREFRYLSPTIQWRTPDRKTGADMGVSLHSIALTNTPFLEELPEVTLNSIGHAFGLGNPGRTTAAKGPTMDQLKIQLCTMLSLALDAGDKAITDAITALAGDAGHFRTLRSELGDTDATGVELAREVKTLRQQIKDAPKPEDLEAARAELTKHKVDTALSAAEAKGIITPKNKSWATKLANSSIDDFDEWAATAEPPVKLGERKPASREHRAAFDPANPTDDEVKALAARLPGDQVAKLRSRGHSIETYCRANFESLQQELG